MVTPEPVALSVPDAVPLVPTMTLPSARVEGKTVSCPAVLVPVPDKEIVSVGLDALDVTVRVAVALPAAVGVNVMLTVAFAPGLRVSGREAALTLNVLLLTPIWEIVRLEPPVLLSVAERDWLCPTVMSPKAKANGFELKAPAEG
jgi:hypothetical protein